MSKEIIDFLKNAPLKDLKEVFSVLADRVYEHRLANQGFVPLEIFESCLGIAGVSISVQIVNQVVDDQGNSIGFALKLRQSDEVGWQNLYHNTCTTGRIGDTPASALTRDQRETFGEIPKNDKLECLGCTINVETERRSSCLTVMYVRKIKLEDMSSFIGTWKFFSNQQVIDHDEQIVNYNWHQLEWVIDQSRSLFSSF
ncbi:MAG: hypothetical protein US83_C0005G0001 [Candidatus Falkowbacteria bacterium GW2011_GWC2_38_22]|nr:MAG: hypothetical protein US83_C0005G0001 [Candidatus Falkowbacteria bacterium GW2011_GWC2_38_22]KKQ72893.1 MAG: hypothetical protein US93_C0005G0093 [Candidatus Falkowbacteria bacterium GW2011_GWD2_38_42]HAM88384.1 hypothetical protein [Candidatus Falkowbacteria bacterium]